jgi:hypothetical protein
MRVAAAAVATSVVLVLLTGYSGPQSGRDTGGTGKLVGTALYSGGPPPPAGQTPGPRPFVNDPVVVRSDGRTVARHLTSASGSFEFVLPPGDYSVELPCQESVAATVSLGRTSRVDFTCQVP